MPLRSGKAHRRIIADDMGAHLRQRFTLGGIDLARHDRTARFIFRQDQFPKPAARTRAQKPDIIGNFEKTCGNSFQTARDFNHGVMGRQSFKFIGRGDEGQSSDLSHVLCHHLIPAWRGVQAGADRCTTLGKFINIAKRAFDAFDAFSELVGISRKFLRQGKWGGVLSMGAADFNDAVKLFDLFFQRRVQLFQSRQQHALRAHGCGNVHRSGEGIIGRLPHIAVIIGMHRIFAADVAAKNFNRTVGDHFIGIHIGLCARTGLPDHERKIIV